MKTASAQKQEKKSPGFNLKSLFNLQMSLQWKVLLLCLLVTSSFYIFIVAYIIPKMASTENLSKVENQVRTAWSVLNYYYNKEQTGELTRTEAQQQAMAAVEEMRYGATMKDYYFIMDFRPVMLMNPYSRQLVDTDVSNLKDKNGKYFIQEMVECARDKGEGLVEYLWQYNDDAKRTESKITYVKTFEPWDWIVGSGVYAVDSGSYVVDMSGKMGIVAAFMSVVFFLLFMGFSRFEISKPLAELTGIAQSVALGEVNQSIKLKSANKNTRDEMLKMKLTFSEMIDYLKEMAAASKSMAEGDLTVDIKPRSQQDLLGNAFVQMKESMCQLVGHLQTSASELTGASRELSHASEETERATQQIAGASQQVSKGASEQADALQNCTTGMNRFSQATEQVVNNTHEQINIIEKNMQFINQISDSIAQVSDNAQSAAAGAKEASESAQKGAKIVNEAVTGMEHIKSTMYSTSSKINELGERSREIGKIIAAIDDIANQTNLLALNAAIEAARAGEQGRGFAVVADEVRKLAEKASASTREITQLIKTIQNGVIDSIAAIDAGVKEVDSEYELTNKSGHSLEEILVRTRDVGKQVEYISSAAQQLTSMSKEMVNLGNNISTIVTENASSIQNMSNSSKDITMSIENVAGVAEENSAATEQVSSSAKEIIAQVHQIVTSGTQLSTMAVNFEQQVRKYKMNGNGHSRDLVTANAGASTRPQSCQNN